MWEIFKILVGMLGICIGMVLIWCLIDIIRPIAGYYFHFYMSKWLDIDHFVEK